MVINIISRDWWKADPPKAESPINKKATHVFWMNVKKTVCYTRAHCEAILRRTQRYNMATQNQRDIRYNFMIGADGNVYEGRGWNRTPMLPKAYARVNSESLLVGFMGYFNTARELPEKMFKTGQCLITHGVASNFIVRDFIFHDFLVNELRGDEREQHKEIKLSRPIYYRQELSAFQQIGLEEEKAWIMGKSYR